ncbi:lysophospholipid acyltransferase 5 X2, partial [Biomphalaria glabrata]
TKRKHSKYVQCSEYLFQRLRLLLVNGAVNVLMPWLESTIPSCGDEGRLISSV